MLQFFTHYAWFWAIELLGVLVTATMLWTQEQYEPSNNRWWVLLPISWPVMLVVSLLLCYDDRFTTSDGDE